MEVSSQGADYHGQRVLLSIIRDITERRMIEDTLLFLSQNGYSPEGASFFRELAEFIGNRLGLDYVCIDKLSGDSLTAETLAIYYDGRFEDNVTYTLADTPAGSWWAAASAPSGAMSGVCSPRMRCSRKWRRKAMWAPPCSAGAATPSG